MLSFLKKESDEVVAPVDGLCVRLEDVPDQVFALKMMGDGFAIQPSQSTICAAMDGTVVMIPSSKHAIGIKNKKGVEILIHIGLDTVQLQGLGFQVLVNVGDKVKRNTPLVKFNDQIMKEKNINMITMVIFTSGYDKEIKIDCYDRFVKGGDVVL